jgi:NADH-quinone oxidoreductase subunit A
MSPTLIAGYLALFFGFGIFFLFIHLLMGRFLRPKAPSVEKLQVYECGEPAIGSSFVQFDLRFYVVALLFIIFDVEVAFFFPWGVVYGKATQLMDPHVTGQPQVRAMRDAHALNADVVGVFDALAVPRSAQPPAAEAAQVPELARTLALLSIVDILVFFAVLLVGFAYVWRRGDLDWVRALTLERSRQPAQRRSDQEHEEPVLVG